MLRRLPLGFAGVLVAAIAIAACSSSNATQALSVGPNFASQTLYAANVTENAVNIYASASPVASSTAGPIYQIGGSNTSMAGPQYIAFDSSSDLWVTNWLSSTNAGAILEFKALATGNVLPFQSLSISNVRPRGIVDYQYAFSGTTTKVDVIAVAVTDPSEPAGFVSGIQFYVASLLTTAYATLAGPATQLNVPSGIAADANDNIYAANLQGASITEYALPAASPTASPTATPTASPSPTPTPTGATATPSPTPAPTATPYNAAPIASISGPATGVNIPTGVAVDNSSTMGNIMGEVYVSDQHSTICTPNCPAILIFSPLTAGVYSGAPARFIAGSNTLLVVPTDVKVDANGNIYVADEAAGQGVVYVFASTASGNVAPIATLKSPGAVIGLGLTP